MAKRDYYTILGVTKDATEAQIKAAYRKLAMQFHPDRNPNNKEAEEKFKEATEAYEVLANSEKRKQYDQFGHEGFQQGGFNNAHGMNMEDIFEDIFGSMFGDMSGNQRQRRTTPQGPTPKTGHDRHKEITISLQEAYLGTKQEISYYRLFPCQACDNKGMKPGTKVQECKQCKGHGQIQFQQGFFVYSQTCPSCGGEGFTIPDPCPECGGQSRKQKLDTFSITIPAGAPDGLEMRVSDKGDAGIYGGKAGNLYIKVHVRPDSRFVRVGNDLQCTVMLTYPQLVFGCQIDIENINGTKETIKVPKGCPTGSKLVIQGKGFPLLKSRSSGNLVVIVQCDIPKKLSTEAKEALTNYSAAIGTTTNTGEGTIQGFFKKFLG
ncbi:molecular chaperone DnaJ [Candidatus Dependentiae bacterium]|nr:molecular chaperone DnaJ [Candidatus Dependentiae bacterium]